MSRRSPEAARGVALIAVLWLVALLTLLATAVAALSVSHRRAAHAYSERVQLDSIADGAIRIVTLRIVAPPSPTSTVPAGSAISLELPGGTAEVTVEREQGRIDLNTADENLIYALFAANGWEEPKAHEMAARIADWADADDETRKGGAELKEYSAAGRAYGPRNGPFESAEELRQVLGGGDISASLFDSLTVYTHASAPSGDSQSVVVTNALKLADKLQLGGHRWLPEGSASGRGAVVGAGASGEVHSLIGEVARIRACARKGSAQRCRLAVVRFTGSLQHPLQVFAWRTI